MFVIMTLFQATRYLIGELKKIYEEREATVIAEWTIENITGSVKTDRIANREKELTPSQQKLLDQLLPRLQNHEPVQYVLNEAWFCGMKFYVDRNVLIPRPETEELVEWIIANCKFPINKLSILDIGCGSGCIAVTLKRKLRKADVWACDISEAALAVAKKNAENIGVKINFIQLDFLNEDQTNNLPAFDIIVSNPPYIPEKDKKQMKKNVLNYEPATALFVPDNDPLIFYKTIANFGKNHLSNGGNIYAEIHEESGQPVSGLFQSKGYSTILKKDMQEKDRMIKAL